MNAVEIEQAITELADRPFDRDEFPFAFLEAFGNKATTLTKLRKGTSNKSELGGVLQTGHIHILVAEPGGVADALNALRASPATTNKRHRVRFLLATDGRTLEAEDRDGGETVACDYRDFPNHFGFFLPLAGISTVAKIRENAFDIRATSRLNKLYVKLLEENSDWGTADRRHDMNHFMARLIFCFFAEDTDIFRSSSLFTATVEQMSDDTNTAWVISEIFRAMSTPIAARGGSGLRPWADAFPYVNGGLFSGSVEVPRFSRIARRYLLHIGHLDWKQINPDIFGSMIQAVADDEERGALGMHYTSVPNILKVLNPLFLDDLRAKLEEAEDNRRKLLNLRKRMARIRVFDPACGSGNFLVIAYKEMRAIEAEINRRRGETGERSAIPLTNFRGIEIRDFSAEIARLALIITEYQADVVHRGQKEALAEFLPLDAENWITCGNALRLDWLEVCPPTGTGVKRTADDLFDAPLDQPEIDFENEGGETYICGNPPYIGARDQEESQKTEMAELFAAEVPNWKSLDYVAAWFLKAALYGIETASAAAFVATNSICQGSQASLLWPLIKALNHEIFFAFPSFNWKNLATHNAGVTVIIVGIEGAPTRTKHLFQVDKVDRTVARECSNINAYLAAAPDVFILKESTPVFGQEEMTFGNTPIDGGNLLFTRDQKEQLSLTQDQEARYIRRIAGSAEFIRGTERYCLWLTDEEATGAREIPEIDRRVLSVQKLREKGGTTARSISSKPHRFQRMISAEKQVIVVPVTSSERREYLPVGLLPPEDIVLNTANAMYDCETWNISLIASRLMRSWIGAVCIRMRTDFRFTPTLGWNTFPVPTLTQKNRDDLTACAEAILLTREAHFPATIADLYDPEKMPGDLRAAHDANDETLERIYIGRRFKNDTERLEKLFDLYTRMTVKAGAA